MEIFNHLIVNYLKFATKENIPTFLLISSSS